MIDYMAIGLVVFFGVMGLVAGSLLQLLRLAAAIFSIFVSLKYSPVISDAVPVFAKSMMMREYGLPILLFAILYMLTVMIIKLLLKMSPVGDGRVGFFSRIFGGIFGAANGLVLTYFIVAVALNAQAESGRKLVLVDSDDSRFVRLVQEHPIKGLTKRNPADIDEMKVKIRQMADDAAEKVGQAAEKAVETADEIRERAEKLADQAGRKVEKVVDEASDHAEGTAENVREAVEKASDEAVDKAGKAKDAASKAGADVKNKVEEVVDGSK